MISLFIVTLAWLSCPLSMADTSQEGTDLACDPVERLVEVQVCDYTESPYGGYCFYILQERPFRINSTDLSALYNATMTNVSPDNEKELRALLSSRSTKVTRRPLYRYEGDLMSQYVPPYQRFTVNQNMILCGSFVVPTPEVLHAFDVPTVDRWMIHASSKKQFYISSEKVVRTAAEGKCTEMGGRLAVLNDSSQHLFVESIVSLHAPHSLTDDSPWTEATAYDDGAYRDWKDGEFGIEISRYVCEKDTDAS